MIFKAYDTRHINLILSTTLINCQDKKFEINSLSNKKFQVRRGRTIQYQNKQKQQDPTVLTDLMIYKAIFLTIMLMFVF